MKQVIIIFATLLILLLMISVFGGSIRSTGSSAELFEDAALAAALHNANTKPHMPEDVSAKPPKKVSKEAYEDDVKPTKEENEDKVSDDDDEESPSVPDMRMMDDASSTVASAADSEDTKAIEPFSSTGHDNKYAKF